MQKRPIMNILLVEDDPGDVELTQQALSESQLRFDLRVVSNGELALDFLRQEGKYSSVERPHLVILDLNLPGLNGQEVLAEMRNDEHLKLIPVLIFSTSSNPEDINNSYKLGANYYLQKPLELEETPVIVKYIENFWFNLVELEQ